MIRSFEKYFESVKNKQINESEVISKMTKELAKEMFEYLDANGEHKLVSKYKGVVTDNDISGVIQAWGTSIKPLEDNIEDYWTLHTKLYKISESNSEIRDIYNDETLQFKAWQFAEMNFPKDVFAHLIGADENGDKVSLQNIESMLNQVDDLGDFTPEEWSKFFEIVRVEGI